MSSLERCRVALDVLGEVLAEECAGHEGEVVEFMKKVLGMKDDDLNPSEKCQLVLEHGLDEDVCRDFRGIRRWVICRAFQLMSKGEAKGFSDAMEKAWDEAKLKCMELGVVV